MTPAFQVTAPAHPLAPALNLDEILQSHGLQTDPRDIFHLRWTSTCVHHPRNWTRLRKLRNTTFINTLEAFGSAMSMAGASAAPGIRSEFALGSTAAYGMLSTLSVVGGFLGSILIPQLSESYGRKLPYILASFSLTISMGLTSLPYLPSVCIGRFLAGFAGSVPSTVAAGSLEDMYTAEERVWQISAWITASSVGMALGPIGAAYIGQEMGWRWIFYIGAIVSFTLLLAAFTIMESRPSLILQRRVALIRQVTGIHTFRVDDADSFPTFKAFAREALGRPTLLLFTEPIVFICSFMCAYSFSLMWGMTEALSVVYANLGFSPVASSLAFIPILIGALLSALCRIYDDRRLKQLAQKNLVLTPEVKLATFNFSAPLFAAALCAFAWTVPPAVNAPWVISMLMLIPVGFAENDFDVVLGGYLVDSYTTYAASTFAALSCMRNLVSIALSLFGGIMFERLDANVAGSVLALAATLFCASPWILRRYGPSMRERSAFVKHCAEVKQLNRATDIEVFKSESPLVGITFVVA